MGIQFQLDQTTRFSGSHNLKNSQGFTSKFKMMSKAFIVFCMVGAALAVPKPRVKGVIPISDCGSYGATLTELTFDGCDGEPCSVERGQNAHGTLAFTAEYPTETLECKIFGIIAGIEVPFPGGCQQVDACADLTTGDCALQAGEQVVYDVNMMIENSFPAVPVTGKWTLRDDNGDNYVCFTIEIEIV